MKDPITGENILDLAMTDLPTTATTLANIGTLDSYSRKYQYLMTSHTQGKFGAMKKPTFGT